MAEAKHPTIEDQPTIEIGVASQTLERDSPPGARYLVAPFSHGTLVAVVEGLGRGEEAAKAASIAVETLETRPDDPPVVQLWRCHDALQDTCGVALTLACFDDQRSIMSWLGVGNIWGTYFFMDPLTFPRRQFLLLRGGVVGVRLPPPKPVAIITHPYDTLVFTTSGVLGDAVRELTWAPSVQQLAEEILARHRTGKANALVLVARYRGPRAPAAEGG